MSERILKDTIIRNRFHRGFSRGLSKPNEIIIHGTGGGNTLEWVRAGGRAEEYYKGIALFHYLIEKDGKIWEIIDPDRWVYHSSSGRVDKKRIGIELENFSRTNSAEYRDEQYDSLFWLCFNILMPRYPKIKAILSHKRAWQKASNGRHTKQCPGPGFHWARLTNYLTSHGYDFTHIPQFESYWNIEKK